MGLGLWILIQPPPLWGFMALAAVVGTGQAFFGPAMTGMVPQIISEAKLQQANALNGLSGSVGGIIGPPLAGLIVAVSSPGWAVLIDGLHLRAQCRVVVSHQCCVAAEGKRRLVSPSTARRMARILGSYLAVGDRRRVLDRGNILIFAPVYVLGPVIAKQSLGGAPAWGLILAFEGAGAVLGGILMLRYHPRRPLLVATISPIAWVWPLIALAYRSPVLVIATGSFVSALGFLSFPRCG